MKAKNIQDGSHVAGEPIAGYLMRYLLPTDQPLTQKPVLDVKKSYFPEDL